MGLNESPAKGLSFNLDLHIL